MGATIETSLFVMSPCQAHMCDYSNGVVGVGSDMHVHDCCVQLTLLKSRCTPPNSHLSPRLNPGGARGRAPLRPKNQKPCNSKI